MRTQSYEFGGEKYLLIQNQNFQITSSQCHFVLKAALNVSLSVTQIQFAGENFCHLIPTFNNVAGCGCFWFPAQVASACNFARTQPCVLQLSILPEADGVQIETRLIFCSQHHPLVFFTLTSQVTISLSRTCFSAHFSAQCVATGSLASVHDTNPQNYVMTFSHVEGK